MQQLGRGTNKSLDLSVLANCSIEWLGNEVSCGVGMQRIDVLIGGKTSETRVVMPIELKDEKIDISNISQIQRYVDWLEQYYVTNTVSDIQPILIAQYDNNKESARYINTVNGIREFNRKNSRHLPLKYIEFTLNNDALIFTPVEY